MSWKDRIAKAREEEAARLMQEQQAQQSVASYFNAITQAIGQGGTFGFGDEAAAGLRWLGSRIPGVQDIDNVIYAMVEGGMPWEEAHWKARRAYDMAEESSGRASYADLLTDQRAARDKAEGEHPGIFHTVDIGTGILSGGAAGLAMAGGRTAGRGVLAEAGEALAARGMGGRAATTIGGGAAEGALSGAGYADDSRLEGALIGGMIGGGLGGAGELYDIGRGLGRAGRRTFQSNQDFADEIVGERLNQQFGSPEEVMRRADQLGPEAMMADIDPTLAVGAAQTSSEARRTMLGPLSERQAAAPERVTGILREEIADPVGYDAAQQATRELRDKAAAEMYGDIRGVEIPVDNVEDLFKSRGFAKAVDRAETAMSLRGQQSAFMRPVYDDNGEVMVNKAGETVMEITGFPLGFVDEVKKQLDKLYEQTGDDAYTVAKNRLLGRIEELDVAQPYATARGDYARESGIMDAGETGRKLGENKNPRPGRAYRQEFAEMTPEEAARGAQGVARGLLDLATPRGETGSPASRILNPESRGVLSEFGPGAIPRLEAERDLYKTFAQIDPVTNSMTAGRQAAAEELQNEAPGFAMDMAQMAATPSATVAGIGVVNQIAANLMKERKVTADVAKRIGEILVNAPSASEAQRLMQKAGIAQETVENVMRQLAAITGAAGAGAVGAQGAMGALSE